MPFAQRAGTARKRRATRAPFRARVRPAAAQGLERCTLRDEVLGGLV